MAANPFYVYALKDPREKPARPFYIGKGTGIRAWEHENSLDESEKACVIRSIQEEGLAVVHVILADDLTEMQALRLEAELIAAFGVRAYGGLLTNRVRPNTKVHARKARLNVPLGCYEKAQLGLALIKEAVLELARSNADGITNGDAAKYLGLQSNYGGGSKDYLSYSVLGLLMQDKLVERSKSKRHRAVSK